MLDWNDLRYFLAIHRERTLSGAGRVLRVDQTTVGRRLAAMEEALGARLFVRHTRGFTLTPAGDAILPAAERAEASVLALERAVSGGDARLEGLVRISTNEVFANRLILPSLADLRDRHPAIHVEVISDSRLVDLTRGEADIAVRARRMDSENLVVRKVGVTAFGLYGSERYLARNPMPAHLADLEGHALVGYSEPLRYLAAARWLDDVARPGQLVFRGNTILSVLAATAAGLGLGVVPCFLGAQEPGLVRIGAPETIAPLDIWLVVHDDVQRVARVRAVLRHITDVFRAHAAALEGGSTARTA